MSYMQAEISGPETWLQIDGSNGITNVPTDVVGLPDCPPAVGEWPVGEEISEDWIAGRLEHTYPQTAAVRAERVWAEIVSAVADCYDGPKDGIQSVQLVTGWGVRSQAPGYMDATEWTVYTSEDEALGAYEQEREECGETDDEDDDDSEDDTDDTGGGAVTAVRCNSCQLARINGVLCHETGCPDAWRGRAATCFQCGCEFTPDTRHQQTCDDCLNPPDDDATPADESE